MSGLYQQLIERIRSETSDLEQVIARIERSWSQLHQEPSEPFAYVDSTALNLHSFYSGLEGLFEQIAGQVDRNLPAGETWHRALLQQITEDLPSLRPAVISQQTATTLDEFRRFRHLIRNVYTINLVPEKMSGLIEALPELWPKLRAELLAFADYLEALDESLS
jgi:hypothetical protein